ncbi:MAG: hypothetical protein AAFU79_16870, partial [Myxococcota bacterium]
SVESHAIEKRASGRLVKSEETEEAFKPVRATRSLAVLGLALGAAACGPEAIPGTQLVFDADGGFWDSPFPGEHRRSSDGGISLAGFPNPDDIDLALALRRLLERDARGFGVSSTIYFRSDAPLEAQSLPRLAETVDAEAPLFLMDADPASPGRGERIPVEVGLITDPGPFEVEGLLALQPIQGWPLREATLHAAVVLREASDAGGEQLGVPLSLRALLEGEAPESFSESAAAEYRRALEVLDEAGVDRDDIAGLTVFRTGRPSEGFERFVEATASQRPELGQLDFAPREVFADFCVFEAEVELPLFQTGRPPYTAMGGGWPADENAAPSELARSRLFLTIPRAPAPAAGYPTTVFIRTGGGGDRPLVDRGVRAVAGGPAIEPGTGPALELARVGQAGLTWDGPHGGLRNPTGGDEQFLVFNFANPEALRDNVRQTALEAVLLADGVGDITVTSTACPGVSSPIRLDPARLALMGHSMGATIAPLTAGTGRFEALVLSGAGGSWIENILFKESPIAVRPIAELLLGYDTRGRRLQRFDPVLALLQWAGEPADPPIYLRRGVREEKLPHVLMMQGLGDTYIPAPVANATSLSAVLDLGAPEPSQDLVGLQALVGSETRSLPLRGNRAQGMRTAVFTQHPGDPIEDPHEVVFQTEAPKHLYRCFLEDVAQGRVPEVAAEAGRSCPP